VIRDVTLSVATRVIGIAAGIATSVLTARSLGVDGRGQYFYFATLANMLVQFGNFGLPASNTYQLAKRSDLLSKLTANSLWVAVASLPLCALAILAIDLLGASTYIVDAPALWLLLMLVPLTLFGLLAGNLLIGLGRIAEYNCYQLGSSLLQVIAIAWVAFAHAEVFNFLLASAGTAAVSCLGLFLWLRTIGALTWRFDSQIFKNGLLYAGKAYFSTMLAYGVSRCGVVILGHYSGQAQVGIYSIAAQFSDVLLIIPSTAASVLFPGLMRLPAAEQYPYAVKVTIKIGILMFILSAGVAILSPWVIPRVFGDSFAGASTVLWWSLPGTYMLSVANIMSQYLGAQGIPRLYLGIWAVGLFVCLACAFLLVPLLGASGIAASLSVAYTIISFFLFRLAQTHHAKMRV
jgi:O-antigen/teichoic acid export membrane protein